MKKLIKIVEDIQNSASSKEKCMHYSIRLVEALKKEGIEAYVYTFPPLSLSYSHYYVVAYVAGEKYIIDAYPLGRGVSSAARYIISLWKDAIYYRDGYAISEEESTDWKQIVKSLRQENATLSGLIT